MREKQINSLQQRLLNSHNLFEGDITFFDGHIQGITYEQFKQYQPDTNDANMMQTQLNNNMIVEEELNIDVLAYYISPHVSQEDFGIYFNEGGINWLASYLENKIHNDSMGRFFMNMPHGQKTEQDFFRDLVNIAKRILLRHELGHYAIDYSLTRCNAVNSDEYHLFRRKRQSLDILVDESICNANVARKQFKIFNSFPLQPRMGFDLSLNLFCKEFLDNQPVRFGDYRHFVRLSYVETCVDALNSIFEMDFSKNDFNEAIRDSSVNHIPLYMVSSP
jgi:hypothetical protein